jgi:hypothetical protein
VYDRKRDDPQGPDAPIGILHGVPDGLDSAIIRYYVWESSPATGGGPTQHATLTHFRTAMGASLDDRDRPRRDRRLPNAFAAIDITARWTLLTVYGRDAYWDRGSYGGPTPLPHPTLTIRPARRAANTARVTARIPDTDREEGQGR